MQRHKHPKRGWLGAILVFSLVGGVLVGAYVMSTPDAQRVPDAIRKQKAKPKVLVAQFEGDNLKFVKRPAEVPPGLDEKVYLINQFLDSNPIAPSDARAIGVDVRDGIAIVSFTEAFDRTYSTVDEGVLLNGILATLGQFKSIDKATFEVNGKPIESLGNIDLTQPQPVIRAGKHESVDVEP